MSFAILRQKAENILAAAGRKASRPLHARVYEILREFRKIGAPIAEIIMGNGVWIFDGPCFAVTGDSGRGDTGETAEPQDLSDWDTHSTWQPKNWTSRHAKLLTELKEILDFLTDEPYLQLRHFKG